MRTAAVPCRARTAWPPASSIDTSPAPRNGSLTSSCRGHLVGTSTRTKPGIPNEVDLPDEVRSSLFVNLLTEDNLPYYFRTIERLFGARQRVGHLGPSLDRGGRPPLDRAPRLPHGDPAIDPSRLERARMAQVECGEVPDPRPAARRRSSTSRCKSSPLASPITTPASCSMTARAMRS